MKIQTRKIMSIPSEGASCTLLVLDGTIRILLDCGINHSLDFTAYREYNGQIKKVQLVLISHSAIEYSGAYAFLVDEFGLNPKIFYTTQPIMRYSPLNLHQAMLNIRHHSYSKKIFNRIYSSYEQLQLVKPNQHKQIDAKEDDSVSAALTTSSTLLTTSSTLINTMQDQNETALAPVGGTNEVVSTKLSRRVINFVCYPAGGSLGSVCWRINFGLINIVYLVQYNNYSLYHINGMDLESLRSQRTHILITDGYLKVDERDLRKEKLYNDLKIVLLDFYERSNLESHRPKPISSAHDHKLLVTCYPNQFIVEVMIALRKIIAEIQQTNTEIIGVVHLSSRYLELVKSQSEYFSKDFQEVMERFKQNFVHEEKVIHRINIASVLSLHGILSNAIEANVSVYHIGQKVNNEAISKCYSAGFRNLQTFKLFVEEEFKQEKMIRSASKMEVKMDEESLDEQKQEEVSLRNEQESVGPLAEEGHLQSNGEEGKQSNGLALLKIEIEEEKELLQEKSKLVGQYISQIGFPHFVSSRTQDDDYIEGYGLRHHTETGNIVEQKDISDYLHQRNRILSEETKLAPKISTVEIMNIVFKLPAERLECNYNRLKYLNRQVHKTGFDSSAKIIKLLKPKDVILINLPNRSDLLDSYKEEFKNRKEKTVKIYELPRNRTLFIQHQNQLMEYKVNFIPGLQLKSIQKVHGLIERINGNLHIHLECLDDSEILEFRMELFYKLAKSKMNCLFTGDGISIEGVKLMRKGTEIVLEGDYSQQFFKVRKMLYSFLGIN